MTEQNKALVRQWLDEVLTRGDTRCINALFAPNYVLHDPSLVREVHGREGVKQYVATFRAASPDVCFIIEDQIAEGDMVVTRWAAHGTHQGTFLGIPATGEQVKVTGMEFDRIVDDMIDESWVSYHLSTDSPLNPERVERVFAMIQRAFPDLHVAHADSVTEGDKVAFRWMLCGTHKGELMGVAPTGERVTAMGIDMICVADGEILGYWGEFDVLGMLRQLGITPPPERVES
jgi:steroid delta-isomerase-like uncharacterized protein